MKQIFNAAVICLIALSACTTPFKKAKDGSQYKIISNKKYHARTLCGVIVIDPIVGEGRGLIPWVPFVILPKFFRVSWTISPNPSVTIAR